MSTKTNRFVAAVEVLERREVPAGNVTGFVQNGSLFLTGDGEDNIIQIRKGLDSSVRILGQDGTTINGGGMLADFAAFKDVIIKLKGGDDEVHIVGGGGGTAADVGRDLIFKGGSGTDTLTSEAGALIGRDLIFQDNSGVTSATLDGLLIGRNALITGNENVQVDGQNFARVHGRLRVQSAGLAGVSIEDMALGRFKVTAGFQAEVEMISNNLVGGNVNIRGGIGDDLVEMVFGNDIMGNLTIRTRSGNDIVQPRGDVAGNVFVHLGSGVNQEFDTPDLSVYGNLTVISGSSGADTWELDNVLVLGRVHLTAGNGADIVDFDGCQFFGAVTFLGNGGADQVQISDSNDVVFRGDTLFDLGNGADTLQLGEVGMGQAIFLGNTTLQGGNGTDTLNDANSAFDPAPVLLSF